VGGPDERSRADVAALQHALATKPTGPQWETSTRAAFAYRARNRPAWCPWGGRERKRHAFPINALRRPACRQRRGITRSEFARHVFRILPCAPKYWVNTALSASRLPECLDKDRISSVPSDVGARARTSAYFFPAFSVTLLWIVAIRTLRSEMKRIVCERRWHPVCITGLQ
jgi:hypothetical protein